MDKGMKSYFTTIFLWAVCLLGLCMPSSFLAAQCPAEPLVTPAVSICGPGVVTLTSTLVSPMGDGVRLYTQGTGGTPFTSSIVPPYTLNTPFTTVTTTYYLASFIFSSGCESARVPVIVTVHPVPAPPLSANFSRCGEGTVTITASTGTPPADQVLLYTLPGGGSPVDAASGPPYVLQTPFLLGTTNFYLEAKNTNTGCVSASRTAVVATIHPIPGIPTAADIVRCGPGISTFSVTNGFPAGQVMRLYTQASGGLPIATDNTFPYTLSDPNPIFTSTIYFIASRSSAGCESNRLQVGVTVLPPLAPPTAPSFSRCGPGATIISATMNLPAGNEMRIYTTALPGPPPFAVDQLPPYEFTIPFLTTTTTFYVESANSNNTCASPKVPVVVTVHPVPGAPVAANVSKCGVGQLTFTAFMGTPTGDEMRLYTTATGGSPIQTAGFPFLLTTPSTTLFTTVTFFLEAAQTLTGCASPRVPVVAQFLTLPNPPTAAGVARCGIGQVTFTAFMGAAPGDQIRIYSVPTSGVPINTFTSPFLIPSPTLTVTTSFYLEAVNSVTTCSSATRTLVVATVHSLPAPPTVPSADRCGPGSVVFTATMNTPAGDQVRIYTTSNPLTTPLAIDGAAPYFLTTPLITINTPFFFTVFNSETGCESPPTQSTAVIYNAPIPSPPSAQDVTRCGGGIVTFSVQMGAIPGNEIRLYTTPTAQFPIATVAQAPYLISPPELFQSAVFYISAGGLFTCESNRIPVIATIHPIPGPPQAQNVSRCGPGPVIFTANMTSPLGTQINLLDASLGLLASGVTNNQFQFTTPSLTTTTAFYLEVESVPTGCKSTQIQVLGIINPNPSPPLAADVSRCGPGPVTFLVGGADFTEAYLYPTSTGGSPIATAIGAPYSLTSPDIFATTSFYIERKNSAGCVSSRTQVVATVLPVPPQPIVSNVSRCGPGDVELTATLASGDKIRLYTQSQGGNPILEKLPPYFITIPNLSQSTTFYLASVFNNTNCESSNRTPVSVIVNPIPSPPLSSGAAICGIGNVTFSLQPGLVAGSEVRLYDIPNGTVPIATDNTLPFNLSTGVLSTTTEFYAEAVDVVSGCKSQRISLTATVHPIPGLPFANDVARCGTGKVTFSAEFSFPGGDEIRLYDSPTQGNLVASATASPFFLTTPDIAVSTPFYLEAVNKSTGCRSNRYLAIAAVNIPPGDPIVPIVQRCGPGVVTFTVSMGAPPGNSVALFTTPVGGAPIAQDLLPPIYELTSISINNPTTFYVESFSTATGCASNRVPAIAVVDRPVGAPIVQPASGCGPGKVTFTAAMGNPAGNQILLYDSPTGGALVSSDASIPYTLETTFLTQSQTFYAMAVNTATGCNSPRVPVEAVIYPVPGLPQAQDISLCASGVATFSATMGIPAGNQMRLYNQPTAGSLIAVADDSPFHLQSQQISVTTTFYLESVNTITGCASNRVAVAAIINPRPGNPLVDNAARCDSGAFTFNPQMTNPVGTEMRLYNMQNQLLAVSTPLTNFVLNTPTLTTTTSFLISSFNAVTGCESDKVTVQAVFNKPPGQPQISDIVLCGSGPTTITAFMGSPTGTEIQLYSDANATTLVGSSAGVGSAYPIPIQNVAATTTYYLVSFNANTNCRSDKKELVIRVEEKPGQPIASDVQRCGPGLVTFTAFFGAPAGNQIRMYDQAVGGNPVAISSSSNLQLTTPLVLNSTTTYFLESFNTNTGCGSLRAPVVATINTLPGIPSTVDQLRCGPGTVVFFPTNGNPPGQQMLLYEQQFGGAPIVQSLAGSALTTPAITTTVTYYLASKDIVSGCESPRRPIVAAINPEPAMPFAADVARCGPGEVTFTAVMGSPPGNQIRLFTQPVGGTSFIIDSNSPYTLSTSVLETRVFYLEVVNVFTGCSSTTRFPVTAIVNSLPGAPIAANVTSCGVSNLTFTAFMGSPAGDILKLYTVASGGFPTAIDATSPFELTTESLASTTSFYLEAENSITGCVSPRTQVIATIQPLPGAPVAANISTCGAASVTFSVAMGSPAGTEVRLYESASGGAPLASAAGTNLLLTSPPITTNTIFYLESYDANTGCRSLRTPVNVTRGGEVGAPSASNAVRCGEGNINITATMGIPSGNVLELYTQAVGGSPITSDAIPPFELVTPFLTATTTFFVGSRNTATGCRSLRTPVIALVANVPEPPIANNVARCGSGSVYFTAGIVDFFGDAVRVYQTLAGNTLLYEDANFPFEFTTTSLETTTTFYLASLNRVSGCESLRIPVVATVTQAPSIPTAPPVARCGEGTVVFSPIIPPNTADEVRLYNNQNELVMVATTPPFHLTTPILAFDAIFSIEAVKNGCLSQRGGLLARVNAAPAPPFIGNVTRCGEGIVTFTASATYPPGTQMELYSTPVGSAPLSIDSSEPYELTTPHLLTNTTFYIAHRNQFTGCISPRAVVTATVHQTVALPQATPVSRCGEGRVMLSATMGSPAGDIIRLFDAPAGGQPLASDAFEPFTVLTPEVSTTTTFFLEGLNSQTGCVSPGRTPITAIVYIPPGVPNFSNVSRCGAGVVTLTAVMTAPGGAIMRFYDAAQGGALIGQDNTSIYEFVTPILTTNVTYYAASFDPATGCESVRSPGVVTILPVPGLPNVTNASRCGPGRVVFSALMGAPAGNDIRLYTSSAVGAPAIDIDTSSPYEASTPVITGTTLFFIASYNSATGCESVRVPVTATIHQPAPLPVANNVKRCGPGAAVIIATMPSIPGNVVRLYQAQQGGAPVATDGEPPFLLNTPPISTHTTYYLEGYNASTGCESLNRLPVTVTVQDLPAPPVVEEVVRCRPGILTFTARIGNPPGDKVKLYDNALSITPIAVAFAPPYTLTTGTVIASSTYFVEVENTQTGCNSDKIPVSAKIVAAPDMPFSQDVERCGPGAVTFTANMGFLPGNQILMYTLPVGGQPILADATPPYTFQTEILPANRTFYLAALSQLTGCESERLPVTATIHQKPGAPLVAEIARCGPGNITFTATMGSPPGSQMAIYDSPLGSVPLAVITAAPYEIETPFIATTTTFYLESIIGSTGCASERAPIAARVNIVPAAPNVESVRICGGGQATFSLVLPSPAGNQVRVYSVPSLGSPIATDLQPPYEITLNLNVTSTFYFSSLISGSNCESLRSAAVGEVLPKPGTPAVLDIQRCGPGAGTFTATMTSPPGSQIRIYNAQAGGLLLGIDNISPYLLTSPETNQTTTYFFSSFNTATNCESERVAAVLNIRPIPADPTVLNLSRCGPGPVTFTASMNQPEGNEMRLFEAFTGGNAIARDKVPPYLLAVPYVGGTRSYFIEALDTLTGCHSKRMSVEVEIKNPPIVPKVADVNRCGPGDVIFTVELLAGSAAGLRAHLYTVPTGGAPIFTDILPPFELSVNNIFATTTFYVEFYNSALLCPSQRVPVIATILPIPSQPVAASVARCGSGSVTIDAFMGQIPGQEMRFYNVPSGGDPLFADDSSPYRYATPRITNTSEFFVEAVGVGGCRSPRTTVTAVVHPVPAKPAVSGVQRCGPGVVTFTPAMGIPPGNMMRLYNQADLIVAASAEPPLYALTTPTQTTTTVYYIDSYNAVTGCASERAPVTAIIVPLPAAPKSFDIERCGPGSVTFTAEMGNPPGERIAIYTSPTATTPLSIDDQPPYEFTTPVNTSSSVYYLEAVALVLGCRSERVAVNATINPFPNPTVSSNTPVCLGSVVNLSASALPGTTFFWQGPGGYTAEGSNPSFVATSNAVAGLYTLTAKLGNCVSPPVTQNVLLTNTPVTPIVTYYNVLQEEQPLCEGQELNLRVINIRDYPPGSTFIWSGPAGYSLSSLLAFPAIPNMTTDREGLYYAAVVVNGCTSATSEGVEVKVFKRPPPPVATNNSPICAGAGVIQLFASEVPGDIRYVWEGPNGFTATSRIAARLPLTANAGVYYVQAIDKNGCRSGLDSTLVVVKQNPQQPIVQVSSPVCVGESLRFTVIGLNGTEFRVSGPNNYNAVGLGPEFTRNNITVADAGVYSFTAIIDNCTSTAARVEVTPRPTPAPPTVSSNSPVCQGRNLLLTAVSQGASLYRWTGPGGYEALVNSTQISRLNAQLSFAGNYSVTAIAGGCTSAPATLPVVVNLTPPAPIVSNPIPLCPGQILSMTASGAGNLNYVWTGPGGFSATGSNITRLIQTNQEGGVYSVTAVLANCTSAPVTRIVVVKPRPEKPTVSNSGPVCIGREVLFSAVSSQVASFNWVGPAAFVAGGSSVSRPITSTLEAGAYSVTATVDGCISEPAVTELTILPAPTVPFLSSNAPLCVGQDLRLSASGGPFNAIYVWSGPNGFTASTNTPTIDRLNLGVNDAGPYSVYIQLPGCNSDPATVFVSVVPKPARPGAQSDAPKCVGETVTFNAVGPTSLVYRWRGPNNFNETGQVVSRLLTSTLEAGTYSVVAVSGSCQSDPGEVNIVVRQRPPAPFVENDGPKCIGQNIRLTATGIAGSTFLWKGPNGFSASGASVSRTLNTLLDAGSYSASIIAGGCTSAVTATDVRVKPLPPPIEASSNGPLCEGDLLQLTATAIQGATYSWQGPDAFLSGLPQPTRSNVTTAQAGTYLVTVSLDGCNSRPATVNVAVNERPLNPTVANNSPLCSGATLELSANSPSANATYLWDGPGGFVSVEKSAERLNVTTPDEGAYNVVAIIGNCTSDISSTYVTIRRRPNPPMITNNSTLCEGQNLQLNSALAPGAIISWSGPANFVSNELNPIRPNANRTFAGTYNAVAIQNGCTSAAASTVVIINPTPPPAIPSSNTPVCAGSTLQLTASNVSGASYRWSGPEGFSSTLQNPAINSPQVNQSGIYTLVTLIGNCASRPATAEVVVEPAPQNITAGNNGPLCVGQDLVLSATFVPGATYLWNGPNGFTSSQQNPLLPRVTLQEAGSYSLTVRIGNCIAQAVTTVIIQRAITEPPTITSNAPICAGQSLQLSTPFVAGATYSWVGPNGFTSLLQNPIIPQATTVNSGSYSLTIRVGACTSPVASAELAVRHSPSSIGVENNGPVICAGSPLRLTASFVQGAHYQWNGPADFTSSEQSPLIANPSVANSGVYSLIVVLGSCSSSQVTTNITVNPKPSGVAAFNSGPVCSGRTLLLTASFLSGASYQWSGPNGLSAGFQNVTINNVSLAAAGIYTLSVRVGGCNSDPVTTIVEVIPTPESPTVISNSPLCTGETLRLTATPVPGARYFWSGPLGLNATDRTAQFTNVSPPYSGAYSAVAIVSGCTSAPGVVPVIVNPNPQPPVIRANSQVCSGQSLQLSTDLQPGAEYEWRGPNNFLAREIAPVRQNVTTADRGIYSLTVSFGRCFSDPALALVEVIPTPPAPVVRSNTPVCAGGNLQLSINPIAGVTYTWRGPSGFSSALTNPTLFNVGTANAGIYSVIASLGGCSSATVSHKVEVTPIRNIDANSNGPLCAGQTLNLSATPIEGATYQWQGPNNFRSLAQNPSIVNIGTTAAGLYSVIAILGGCTSNTALVNLSVTNIPNRPNVYNNGPLCEGETLQLSVDFIPGATYSWSGPRNFSSFLPNPSRLGARVADAGVYSLLLQVGACTSNLATTIVEINPSPSNLVARSNAPVCAGSTLALSVNFINGANYNWRGPMNYSASGPTPAINNVSTAQAGVYTVTATLGNCSSTAFVNVQVGQTPEVLEISNSGPLCVGGFLELYAPPVPGASYSWVGPNGFSSAEQNPIRPNIGLADAGEYSLTVFSAGCSSRAARTLVEIFEQPNRPVAGNNGPLCVGQNLQLTATSIPGATYIWSGPRGFNSTAQNPLRLGVNASMAGTYTVVALLNDCASQPATTEVIISEPTASVKAVKPIICAGDSSGIEVTLRGIAPWRLRYRQNGTPGEYFVTSSPFNVPLLPASNLNYTLTSLIDGLNCEVGLKSSADIAVVPEPNAQLLNATSVCYGDSSRFSILLQGLRLEDEWSLIYEVGGREYNARGKGPGLIHLFTPPLTDTTLIRLKTLENLTVGCSRNLNSRLEAVVLPPATARFISEDITICEGIEVNWGFDLMGKGPWEVVYAINGEPDTLVLGSEATPSPARFTFSYFPRQTVTYEILSVRGRDGCSATAQDTFTIFVNPLPRAASGVRSNTPVCTGDTLRLYAAGEPGVDFYWQGPGGYTSLAANPQIIPVTMENMGVYTVVTVARGCTAKEAVQTSVQVRQRPSVRVLAAPAEICLGQAAELILNFSGGPAFAFAWQEGGAGARVVNGVESMHYRLTVVPQTPGDKLYTISQLLDSAGCVGAAAQTNLRVLPNPFVEVVEVLEPACGRQSGALRVRGRGGADSLYRYAISGREGFNTTGAFEDLTAGVYTVTVLSGSCSGTAQILIPGATQAEITTITASEANAYNTATINWQGATGAVSYTLLYRVSGSGSWQEIPGITATSYTLQGLISNTRYEFSIRTQCANGQLAGNSAIQTYTTAAAPSGCLPPSGITLQNIGATSAQLRWQAATGAVCYIISYGPIGTPVSSWNQLLIPGGNLVTQLDNLRSGVRYGVILQTNCSLCSSRSGARSPESPVTEFNTTVAKEEKIDEKNAALAAARLYPNPTQGKLILEVPPAGTEILEVLLSDIMGKVLRKYTFAMQKSEPLSLELDFSDYPSGVYHLELSTDKLRHTQKIILHR
jgi:hypothetical protein